MEPAVLVTAIISSIFLIVFIAAILFVFVQRSPGLALCLIGVVMSIAAAVQASVSGVGVHTNAGQFVAVASGSSPLLKVAVILVLSGVALMYWSRPQSAAVASEQKETTHVA
jgi:predicted tellurium resistance membrane protein TerC